MEDESVATLSTRQVEPDIEQFPPVELQTVVHRLFHDIHLKVAPFRTNVLTKIVYNVRHEACQVRRPSLGRVEIPIRHDDCYSKTRTFSCITTIFATTGFHALAIDMTGFLPVRQQRWRLLSGAFRNWRVYVSFMIFGRKPKRLVGLRVKEI